MEETNFNDFYKDLILLSRILLNVNAVDVFNLLICHEKAENRVQTALTHHFKNALKTQNIPMSADLKLIKSVFPSVSIDQISTDLFQQTSGNAASRVELVLKKYLRDENTDSLSVGLKRNYLCCDNLNDSTSKKIKSNYIDFESVEGMIKLDVFDRPSNTLNVNTNASSIEEYISGKETNSSLDIAENLCNVDECIIISDDNISNNNESLNLDFDNINKNSERLAATNLNDEFCVTKSYTENVADIINLMPKSRVKFEDENISDIETSFVYTLKGSILKNPPKTFNDILQIERDKLLQVPTDYRLCKSANKSHDKLNVSKYYLDTCKSILPIVSVDNNTNPTNSSLIVPGYRSNLLSTSEKQTAVNNSAEMSKTPVCEDHKHMLRVRKSSATDGVSNSTDMLKTRLYENQKNGLRRKKFPAITVNNSALMPKPRLCQNQKLTQISATIVSNNSELMPKTHLCQDQKFKRITAIVASNNSVVMPKSRLCQNQKLKEIPATVESNNSAVMSKARSCENQKLKQIPATIASNNPVEIHNMRVCENQSRTLAYNSLAIPNIDVCENQNHVLKQKQIPATIVRPVESDTDDDKPLNKRLTNFNTIINGFIGEHRGNASTSSSSEFMVHDDEDLSVASADYEDKWVKATVVHPYNLQTATVGLPHNLQTATARPAHNLETSSTYTTSSGFHEYYFKILEMFPDICPTYLKQFLSTTLSTSLDEIITALLDANNFGEMPKTRLCENPVVTASNNPVELPNVGVCENQDHMLKQEQIPATTVHPVESCSDENNPLKKRLNNFDTFYNILIGEHRGNASTSDSSDYMEAGDDEGAAFEPACYEHNWETTTAGQAQTATEDDQDASFKSATMGDAPYLQIPITSSEDEDSTFETAANAHNSDTATTGRVFTTLPENDEDVTFVSEGYVHNSVTAAAGPVHNSETPSTSTASSVVHEYYFKMLEMFPDICPTYLGKFLSTEMISLDEIITTLLEGTYKKRDTVPQLAEEENFDFENQYATLLELFPDADPTFLQNNCEQLIAHPEAYKAFVADLIENRTYPSKEDYLKKMNLSAQERQYTTEFDVKHFLQLIPDPIKHFSNRTPATLELEDSQYALTFLKNHYGFLTIREINNIFKQCNYDMIYAAGALTLLPKTLKSKRKPYPLPSCKNIPLLQELAYIKHNKEILDYIKDKEISDKESKVEAKEAGTLKTCQCCFDDEIMPADTIFCDNGHLFCKDCVRKGCEVKIGEGKLNFPCLEDCDQQFSLQILKSVLTPKVFSKMAQRKQLEEVKAAGIEDLEFCPFCDFATIPALGDKLFRCMNNDCMKESCRECKEPSHIPLRCDEVEREQDVKQRIYIENKMTDALLRKCYNCGMKFIKESGCNKMTCSCGAIMCYVCKQPVKDYRHFNGQGGDKHHLCPLYSDINELHLMAIKRSAEDAKKELGLNTNAELKIDPAQDIDQHYKKKPKQQTVQMNELHRNLVHLQHQLHYHRHRHHVVHAHRHRHHRHE